MAKQASKTTKATKATPKAIAKVGDKARAVDGIAHDVTSCAGTGPAAWYVYATTSSKGARTALLGASGDNAATMALIIGRSSGFLCFVTPAEYALFVAANKAIGEGNPFVQSVAKQLDDMVVSGRNKACRNAGIAPYGGSVAWANVPASKRWLEQQAAAKTRLA